MSSADLRLVLLLVLLVCTSVIFTTCNDAPVAPDDLSISAAKGGIPGPPDGQGGGGGKDESFALSFDGATQHTFTDDADDLDLTTTWTLEAWIKPTNVAGSFQHIVSKWNGGGDASYNIVVHQGHLRSSIHNGSTSQGENSIGTLTDDVWQHVAVTFDSGTWRFYINGSLDRTVVTALIPMNSTRPVSLGREGPPANIKYYSGVIDEVRIWNISRTAREIAKNMSKSLNVKKVTGLVAYWPLDEGTGQFAEDASGNGHRMQLGDSPSTDGADPTWVPVSSRASVLVSPENADFLVGGSPQLSTAVYDQNRNLVTDPVVVWSSSDETVATVDANGLVQGIAAGEAIITAESEGASGTATVTVVAHCPLPLALPNRWTETDGDNRFSGPPYDLYIPYAGNGTQCAAGTGPPGNGCDFTGYYPGSVNNPLEPMFEITTYSGPPNQGDPTPTYVDSPCTGTPWRCFYSPVAGGGASSLISWIVGCPDESVTVLVDDLLDPETGNVQSTVLSAFRVLVDNNPATWNDSHPTHPSGACATVDGGNGPCLGSEHPRIRLMPVVKTDQLGDNQSPAPVAGRTCVFIDKVSSDFDGSNGSGPAGQWNIYLRFTDTCSGFGGWDDSF